MLKRLTKVQWYCDDLLDRVLKELVTLIHYRVQENDVGKVEIITWTNIAICGIAKIKARIKEKIIIRRLRVDVLEKVIGLQIAS